MRVCFVQGGAERAGAERVLLWLLGHLDRSLVEPVVVFLADGPFVEEVRATGVEVALAGPMGRLRQLPSLPATVSRLRCAIEALAPDIVQATGEKVSILAALAARRRRWPVVAWLHDAPAGRGDPAAALTQLALALAPTAAVVTCSAWMARAFNRRLRLGAVAIPNGLPVAQLSPSPQRPDALADACGWPRGSVIVAHVARLERWKGTDVFLRAAAAVAPRHPEVRFAVIGGTLFGRDTDWAGHLAGEAGRLGLGERLRFLGHRDDVLELMAGADVVVHASRRSDPFPTVVLEAMALGRAVVATRTGGPEEALGDGAGLLVPPGDPAAMAAAIAALVADPGLRAHLGDAGRRRVEQRYRADRMAREFEALWGRLAPQRTVGVRR